MYPQDEGWSYFVTMHQLIKKAKWGYRKEMILAQRSFLTGPGM